MMIYTWVGLSITLAAYLCVIYVAFKWGQGGTTVICVPIIIAGFTPMVVNTLIAWRVLG